MMTKRWKFSGRRKDVRQILGGIRNEFSFSDFALLTAGALILAFAFDLFLAPAQMAPGGISGLTIILTHFIDWSDGITMLALSVPIVALGFFHLGGFRFLTRTAYVTLLYTFSIDFLAQWLPSNGITDDALLNAFFAGVIGGIGTGLIFRGRGTSPGSGILTRILQLKTGIPTNQLYILIDGGIILLLGLLFGWENSLYALIALFTWGSATDYVLDGPSVIRTVFIVTDAPEAVSRALFDELGIGVTGWSGRGMYTGDPRNVLFCTVSRSLVREFRSAVLRVDPRAFVAIGQGHQASGGTLRGSAVSPASIAYEG